MPNLQHPPTTSQDHTLTTPVRAIRARASSQTAICVGLLVVALCCAAPTAAAPQEAPAANAPSEALPDFKTIEAAVAAHFASLNDARTSDAKANAFQPTDLLSQSQIERALNAARDAGWDVADRKNIIERGLADKSFLVKEFSTPAGRNFMRRIAREPGAYSRLDRLSTIAGGQQLIRDLVRQKDGDKLIEYLTTTQGGQNMGRMAAQTKHGVNLNKPTDRIYTAQDLMAALKKQYDLEIAQRAQTTK